MRAALALLACLAALPGRGQDLDWLPVGGDEGWSNSLGRGTVAVDDGVVRAAFSFGDAGRSEPLFVNRRLDPPVARRPLQAVRFRYRFDADPPAGARRAPLEGFRVRLRTSPTAFTDFDVPAPQGGWPVGEWVPVTLPTSLTSGRVRNVYATLFTLEPVQELTFRLDDIDAVNAAGTLSLTDIAFGMAPEESDRPYTPRVSERADDGRLDLLWSAPVVDGWYDLDTAARALDEGADVLAAPFRGLHFPLWEWPGSREALLARDVIALLDVDPWVLTREQTEALADAVHSGAGLLVGAGPNSFGAAQRHLAALLELLPVTYEPGAKPVRVNARAEAAGEHALLAGMAVGALGEVGELVPVTPKPGAEVLLSAGGHPLLVVGGAGRGRVAVLTAWPQPRAIDDGAFFGGAWRDLAARLLAELSGRALPPAPSEATAAGSRAALRWLYSKPVVVPGKPFGVVVTPRPGEGPAPQQVRVELVGESLLWSAEAAFDADAPLRLSGSIAEAEPQAVALRLLVDGEEVEREPGFVVAPLERDGFFPIISFLPYTAAGHFADRAGVEALIDDLQAHGFNTIAVGGFGANEGGGIHAELRGWAEAYAASKGMASILEYTHFTAYRRGQPYPMPPFDPAFEPWLAERLAAGIAQAAAVPRLLSVKYVDEPEFSPENWASPEATAAAFGQVMGAEWIPRDAIETLEGPARLAARWRYAQFASKWLQADFATGQRIKTAAGAPWDLLVTFYGGGYGGTRPLGGYQDAHAWSRPADRFDFDVYPYFYPTSERLRFVQADWAFAASRSLAREQGKPWGYYFELDDRNWPYQQSPAEASAESAYTAIAAGAGYLNSFIHRPQTGSGARPERWEKAGEALREIGALGERLTRWQRVPARAAVLWPETTAIHNNGWGQAIYTRALLAQALGDADVLHEQHLASGPPRTLDVLVFSGVTSLERGAQAGLLRWLAAGGTLLADELPSVNELGEALDWPAGLAERAAEVAAADAPQAGVGPSVEVSVGQGTILLVPPALEPRLREAVEGSEPAAWDAALDALDTGLTRRLRRHPGVVVARAPEHRRGVDVGVRRDETSGGVFVVNHDPEPRRVRVETRGWGFAPARVVRLPGGQALPAAVEGDAVTFEVEVPGRWAVMVGVEAG